MSNNIRYKEKNKSRN